MIWSRPPTGPSPRGWGERCPRRRRCVARQTIPTRVGRTVWQRRARQPQLDHPHAGGENLHCTARRFYRSGPSPRGWGERGDRTLGDLPVRTIPTRVGRTSPPSRRIKSPADHPHAGGENAASLTGRTTRPGPSPRGWGELCPQSQQWALSRTIPTRVGRTSRLQTSDTRKADHPHAGGENGRSAPMPLLWFGPSPRGWGERRSGPRPDRLGRTIPTRVGRTRFAP